MFNLKTASPEVKAAAAAMGIKSGWWEPVDAGRQVSSLPDDAPVVRIWNRRTAITITAGDIRYAGRGGLSVLPFTY